MSEIDAYGHPVERVQPQRPPQPAPLTLDELKALVKIVIAYTRREPDETIVEVWAKQSHLARWTYQEAADAIHQWGMDRAPDAFLEPSDVTRLIRAARQDRAMRAEQERNRQPGNPASAARIRQIIDGVAEQLGWTDDTIGERGPGPALTVACPHCHAPIGRRCNVNGQPLRKAAAHPSRAEALAKHLRDSA